MEVICGETVASIDEVTSDSLMSPPRLLQTLTSSIRQRAAASLLRTPSPDIRSGMSKENKVVQVRENLDRLSTQAAVILVRINSNESMNSASGNPFSGTLEFALGRVPEERKLECLMVMLQVANSFAQGKNPRVYDE